MRAMNRSRRNSCAGKATHEKASWLDQKMSPVRRHTGFAPERKLRGADAGERSSKIAAEWTVPRFFACSTTRSHGTYIPETYPPRSALIGCVKERVKTSVLSNYLSQHALVLRGADTISNARTGEFSATSQPTELREADG